MSDFVPDFPFNDQTWLISYTHFFHENIGRYCSRPDSWQDLVIENWNQWIRSDDIVFHLGDLALGKKETAESLFPLLLLAAACATAKANAATLWTQAEHFKGLPDVKFIHKK